MTPHETVSTTTPGDARATAPPPRTFGPQGPTLGDLSDAYLQDYQVRQFRSRSTARGRVAHLTAFFGRAARAATFTTHQIRQYQLARRAAGAATGTINRETSALHRMGTLAVHWGWLDTVPGFPDRLRENPPRQGFFEHPEYLAVRAHLPAPWQDILDLAYYSGWRKQEILGLTWEEIDMAGGVIRLSPARSKTLVGRILPISQPIAEALAVLVPLAVDQAAVRCSYGHENVGSSAVPGSLRWTITGMRTTATKKRRERPRAVKMSLQFSRVLTTPACIAGVLVSRPNFNALCGRPKL